MLRALMRVGIAGTQVTRLTLTDLRVDGSDVLARPPDEREWRRAPGLAHIFGLWRAKRAALGLSAPAREAPCFTTADGAEIPAETLPEHLRSARMIRLNGAFNTLLCTGLGAVRYGVSARDGEQASEQAASDR
jgi:hypothetical protein